MVRERAVETLQGVDEYETQRTNQVRASVASTFRAGGEMASDVIATVNEVVRGVLPPSTQKGVAVVVAVKAVTKGVILGVSDVGGDVLGAAYAVTRAAVRAAADLGADVGMASWRAVAGVIDAGAEIGADAGKLIEAGTKGAIEAAVSSGKVAVQAVEQAITRVSESIRNLVSAALPAAPAEGMAVAPATPPRPKRSKPQRKPSNVAKRAPVSRASALDRVRSPAVKAKKAKPTLKRKAR